jgi:hypothetical protein
MPRLSQGEFARRLQIIRRADYTALLQAIHQLGDAEEVDEIG